MHKVTMRNKIDKHDYVVTGRAVFLAFFPFSFIRSFALFVSHAAIVVYVKMMLSSHCTFDDTLSTLGMIQIIN